MTTKRRICLVLGILCACCVLWSQITLAEEKLEDDRVDVKNESRPGTVTFNLSCPLEFLQRHIEIVYTGFQISVHNQNTKHSHQNIISILNNNCFSSYKLLWLKRNCHGKQNCTIRLTSFSAKCPNNLAQLKGLYRCVHPSKQCQLGQFFFEDSCYEVFQQYRASYKKAESFCKMRNGQLASLPSFIAAAMVEEDHHRHMASNTSGPYFKGSQTAHIWMRNSAVDSRDKQQKLSLSSLYEKLQKNISFWGNSTISLITPGNISSNTNNNCLSLITWNAISHNYRTDTTWKSEDCGRRIGWMCQFSVMVLVLPTRNISSSFVLAPSHKTTLSRIGLQKRLALPLVQQYNLSGTIRPFCDQVIFNGDVWEKSALGTFAVKPCTNRTLSQTLKPEVLKLARNVVKNLAADQETFYDLNIAQYPAGFMFWMCGETPYGPRYQPISGPVTTLCDPSMLLSRTEFTEKYLAAMTMATNLANMTASVTLSGRQIVNSVEMMQNVMINQSSHSSPVEVNPATNMAVLKFASMMTKSVSNLLKDVHRSSWSELTSEERFTAGAGLMRTTEKSAAMLAHMKSTAKTRMQFDNVVVEVMVAPAKEFSQDIVFSASSNADSENHTISSRYGKDLLLFPAGLLKNDSMGDSGGIVRLSFTQYNEALSSLLSPAYIGTNFSNLSENQTVNSRIVSASVINSTLSELPVNFGNETITVILHHTYPNGISPTCVFWNMHNLSHPFWDSTGCYLFATNRTYTTCKCNHLTSFAILTDFNGVLSNISKANKFSLSIISCIGCVISIICLCFCLTIFTFFRQLWCDRVTIHRNLSFCLLIAQFVFILGADRVNNQVACSITAGLLHYILLAAFAWMLLEGLQLYFMLVIVFESEKSRKTWYYVFGYGMPGVVVAIAAGIRPDHYGTKNYCWLNPANGFVWSFVAPVIIVVCTNLIFLSVALFHVIRVRSPTQRTEFQKARGWLRGSLMLFCLLGITWLFGLLYLSNSSTIVFAYIFTVCNSFQGLFIFIFHCVMNEKVWLTIRHYLDTSSWCPLRFKTSATTDQNGTSSSSNGPQSSKSNILWSFVKRHFQSQGQDENSHFTLGNKHDSDGTETQRPTYEMAVHHRTVERHSV